MSAAALPASERLQRCQGGSQRGGWNNRKGAKMEGALPNSDTVEGKAVEAKMQHSKPHRTVRGSVCAQ